MKTVLDSKLGEPLFFVDKTVGSKTVRFPDPRATRAMVALMDMEATIGGAASHFGGPAAFAEMASALFTHFKTQSEQQNRAWTDCFHFVNDAGHCENGIYALRANLGSAGLTLDELKSFRSISSRLTGHGEAHLFPEGVLVSNGPLGSSFGQAQGLALADCLLKKDRITVLLASDGASMEGEAREVFSSLPGMATKGALNPFVMIISDNNTKLSGRIDNDSFPMAPTFESLSTLGWNVIRLENGNDLIAAYETIQKALQKAKSNPHRPVCIWAKTVKGYGNKKAAESASGGHGFSLKSPAELPEFLNEIYEGEALPQALKGWMEDLLEGKSHSALAAAKGDSNRVLSTPLTTPAALQGPTEKVQGGVSRALIRLKEAGLPLVSVTSDLPGSTGVDGFRKAFPQASFDVGVAESNMVSVAAGLSRSGFVPVVDTFAQFGTTKGALPLIMANLSQAPVICFYSHTGFQDAADGASHQSLSYWSMTAAIPNVEVIHLATSSEAERLVFEEIQEFQRERNAGRTPNSLVFLLGRESFPKSYPGENHPSAHQHFQNVVTSAVAKPGLKVALLATAPLLPEAIWAQAELTGQFSVPTDVWHIPCPQRVQLADLKAWILKEGITHLVCSQDHTDWGGFGNWLGCRVAESKVEVGFRLLSVSSQFGRSAYQASDLYELYGLGRRAIVKATLEEVKQHV